MIELVAGLAIGTALSPWTGPMIRALYARFTGGKKNG